MVNTQFSRGKGFSPILFGKVNVLNVLVLILYFLFFVTREKIKLVHGEQENVLCYKDSRVSLFQILSFMC